MQTDPTAVFGRRVLAVLIDAALILVPVIMLITSTFEYHDIDDLPVSAQEFCDSFEDETGGICVGTEDIDDRVYFSDGDTGPSTALYWGATFGLLVLLQGFTGWTIGKLVTGIRLVGEDGGRPGFVKALVRWLLWIVDGFPYFLPLVGFIVGLTTVGHRRVGDMVAKTFVVRSSAAGSPIVVPGLTAPPPPAGGGWGTPPPDATGASAGWGEAIDPAPTASGPKWDEARGTYIQWDPAQGVWMQWNEGLKTWSPIPGQ